jgi:hypothetical protein
MPPSFVVLSRVCMGRWFDSWVSFSGDEGWAIGWRGGAEFLDDGGEDFAGAVDFVGGGGSSGHGW